MNNPRQATSSSGRAKAANQLGRQVRDKAHVSPEDNSLAPSGKHKAAHRRVQRGKKHVLGHHLGARSCD